MRSTDTGAVCSALSILDKVFWIVGYSPYSKLFID
eukprot:SAG22_NODE_692_length_7878_cov_6.834812_4_plen_35_part_00